MSHMVIFRTPDGKPGYQPAETVADAVAIVERLRNDEGVEKVHIYRLEEVTFEYRPYYRVEIAAGGVAGEVEAASGAGSGSMPVAAVEPAAPPYSPPPAGGVLDVNAWPTPPPAPPAAAGAADDTGDPGDVDPDPDPGGGYDPTGGRRGLFSR